jgi:hypothetical protein
VEPRAYRSGALGTPPALPATAVKGYPRTAGTNAPATVPGPHWFYMIGEEGRNLIIAGGVAPSLRDRTQMLRAILNIGQAA